MVNIQHALGIRGWMSAAELTWIAETASRSVRVLEIGCFVGRTTTAIVENLGYNRPGQELDCVIYCVDPHDPTRPDKGLLRVPPGTGEPVTTKEDGDRLHGEFLSNIASIPKSKRSPPIHIERRPSADWLNDLSSRQNVRRALGLNTIGYFDFIFIDGAHTEEGVGDDIDLSLPFLAKHGVLAGHDYYGEYEDYNVHHAGVKRAVESRYTQEQIKRPVGSIWYVENL